MAQFKIQVAQDVGKTNIEICFQKYLIMGYSFWDEINNLFEIENFQRFSVLLL